MASARQHTDQILTKRPDRVARFTVELPLLPNVWLGASVESAAYLGRLDDLRRTRAAVRFVSLEPLLGSVAGVERLLWRHLRRSQLGNFRFRRQRPIGPYVSDFTCVRPRIIVELDGSQHAENAAYDSRRDAFLRANGFRVLRFWNGDVVHRTESVLETIFEALHRNEMDGRFE